MVELERELTSLSQVLKTSAQRDYYMSKWRGDKAPNHDGMGSSYEQSRGRRREIRLQNLFSCEEREHHHPPLFGEVGPPNHLQLDHVCGI